MSDMIRQRMTQVRVLRLANRIYSGRLFTESWYVSIDARVQRICEGAYSMETSTHNNPALMNVRFLDEVGVLISEQCLSISEFWVLLDLDDDQEVLQNE